MDNGGSDDVPDVMGIVQDALGPMGPMLGNILGSNLRPILRGADIALEGVFRLVSAAYRADRTETQRILESDDRAMEKVARLNDLVLDGDGDDE